MLYCCKRKNTETDKSMAGKAAGKAAEPVGLATTKLSNSKSLGTQSAGFTGTKVQRVWAEVPLHLLVGLATSTHAFLCLYTSSATTHLSHILLYICVRILRIYICLHSKCLRYQFACFTGTKVRILTQKAVVGCRRLAPDTVYVPRLHHDDNIVPQVLKIVTLTCCTRRRCDQHPRYRRV